jgi:hypothetical protein
MGTGDEPEVEQWIRPRIAEWRLKQDEARLFEHREQIANWRLADKCRRVLAETSRQLSAAIPEVTLTTNDELRPYARRYAAVSACGIGVRAAGSVLAQVGAGYVVEAGGSLRRINESRMHLEAVLKDPGSDYALRFLQGKGSKLAKLSGNGKNRAEVDALSKLAHAHVGVLRFLSARRDETGNEVDHGEFNVWPAVDPVMAESILYVVADETMKVAVAPARFSASAWRCRLGSRGSFNVSDRWPRKSQPDARAGSAHRHAEPCRERPQFDCNSAQRSALSRIGATRPPRLSADS